MPMFVVKFGFLNDGFSHNDLLYMYVSFGFLEKARRVFDKMRQSSEMMDSKFLMMDSKFYFYIRHYCCIYNFEFPSIGTVLKQKTLLYLMKLLLFLSFTNNLTT